MKPLSRAVQALLAKPKPLRAAFQRYLKASRPNLRQDAEDARRKVQAGYLKRAHQAVARAIKRGELAKLPQSGLLCVDCLTEPAQHYDHRDYTKPLDVEPVCRPCNALRGSGRRSITA